MLPRQEGQPAWSCPLLYGHGSEDIVWGSELYGWEGLGGTEEETKEPWEGVSCLLQGWTRPWAF